MAERVGVEHADENRKLAFAVQATEIGGGVGDPDLIGEVAHHAGNDLVADLLLVARLVDETGGGFVRGVGAVPDFRPAENRQRCTGQATTVGFDQVELAAAVLVDLIAGGAEILGDGDVAVEREHVLVQRFGLLHDFVRVAGIVLEPNVPHRKSSAGADRQSQRQADEKSLFRTWFCHCHLSQVRRRGAGAEAFAIWEERVDGRGI